MVVSVHREIVTGDESDHSRHGQALRRMERQARRISSLASALITRLIDIPGRLSEDQGTGKAQREEKRAFS